MKFRHPAAFLASLLSLQSAHAHDTLGHNSSETRPEIDIELFTGEDGYIHGGVGLVAPAGEEVRFGLVTHFVREESGGEIFPSVGAEIVREFRDGWAAEVFGFGYAPVESQSAWAIGLRGSRQIEMNPSLTVTPFFGPTFARVRAIEEAIDSPVAIGHLMLLGGVTVEAGPVEATFFASHSFFSRDSTGLETHVDLEEMTHLAIYENNDGFAENTLGAEFAWLLRERLTIRTGYAWIKYEDSHRHSVALTPVLTLTDDWSLFGGIQLIRGGGADSDLILTGLSRSF